MKKIIVLIAITIFACAFVVACKSSQNPKGKTPPTSSKVEDISLDGQNYVLLTYEDGSRSIIPRSDYYNTTAGVNKSITTKLDANDTKAAEVGLNKDSYNDNDQDLFDSGAIIQLPDNNVYATAADEKFYVTALATDHMGNSLSGTYSWKDDQAKLQKIWRYFCRNYHILAQPLTDGMPYRMDFGERARTDIPIANEGKDLYGRDLKDFETVRKQIQPMDIVDPRNREIVKKFVAATIVKVGDKYVVGGIYTNNVNALARQGRITATEAYNYQFNDKGGMEVIYPQIGENGYVHPTQTFYSGLGYVQMKVIKPKNAADQDPSAWKVYRPEVYTDGTFVEDTSSSYEHKYGFINRDEFLARTPNFSNEPWMGWPAYVPYRDVLTQIILYWFWEF